MLYSDIAYALDEQYQMFNFQSWSELSAETHNEWIGTSNGRLRVPRLLVLQVYNRVPAGRVRFSRRNIFVRDEHTCQYCGSNAETVDHVVPRSRGGRHTWDNVVAACRRCNGGKRDRLLGETTMRLARAPGPPPASTWIEVAVGTVPSAWTPYLAPERRSA